jgi:hypothetical protein
MGKGINDTFIKPKLELTHLLNASFLIILTR